MASAGRGSWQQYNRSREWEHILSKHDDPAREPLLWQKGTFGAFSGDPSSAIAVPGHEMS
jgi:hypothetical protein